MKTRVEWSKLKNDIRNAIFLAAAAMFVSLPMFYYQFRHLTGEIFPIRPTPEKAYYLALGQSFMVFCPALLSALIGLIYAERLRLPGLGKPADIRCWLPVGIAAGLLFTPVSYAILDRGVIRAIPGIYPDSALWALAIILGGALSQEVIVRSGLLTIGVYLWRRWRPMGHPWPPIAVISVFGAAGSHLLISRLNMAGALSSSQIMTMLLLSFSTQWVLCEVYVRKGFFASICIHVGLSAKYLVFAGFFPT